MLNCSKVKRTQLSVAILVLLLTAAIMTMLSGCGNSQKHSHSGTITSGGSALSGVTVAITGQTSRAVVTDTNGNYSFSGLPAGTYTVTPSFTGYTFIPTTRTAYLETSDGTGFDFSAYGPGRVATATHSVYLRNDGTVWAWGRNSNGQLGDGTTIDRLTPVQVSGLSSMAAIAAGYDHTVALRNDGTVWAWGNNSNGQLGDGTTTDRLTPVQVSGLSDANVVIIAAGYDHAVALRNDGTVWAWGSNSNGQIGNGTQTDSTTPVQVSGLSSVTYIAAGVKDTVSLRNDGPVWAWGSNSNGQLGDGTTTDRLTPVQTH